MGTEQGSVRNKCRVNANPIPLEDGTTIAHAIFTPLHTRYQFS